MFIIHLFNVLALSMRLRKWPQALTEAFQLMLVIDFMMAFLELQSRCRKTSLHPFQHLTQTIRRITVNRAKGSKIWWPMVRHILVQAGLSSPLLMQDPVGRKTRCLPSAIWPIQCFTCLQHLNANLGIYVYLKMQGDTTPLPLLTTERHDRGRKFAVYDYWDIDRILT